MTPDEFLKYLRNVLNHLYDPDYLRQSPLTTLFGVANRFDAPSALQRILTKAIETLKPPTTESQSPAWRTYSILSGCYVQQLDQRTVAGQLGVSERTLRREQQVALQVLIDQLWQQFDLGARIKEAFQQTSATQGADTEGTGINDELAWLKNLPLEKPTNLAETVSSVLDLALPMATQYQVKLEMNTAQGLPTLAVHPVALKQILLNLLDVAIHQGTGGLVKLTATLQQRDVEIQVQRIDSFATFPPLTDDDEASLKLAQQLVTLCGGELVLKTDLRSFIGTLSLPVVEQLTVLAIDDQADTLQLLTRYTSGTRYSLVGGQDPQQVLSLAKKYSPHIIVLDAMMPEIDGWSVLAQLRQHPLTSHLPIIICTILPQEDLSLSLGANAFIRKPIARHVFLDTLDAQIKLMGSEFR